MYYSLELADGTSLSPLSRLNPSTFELKSEDGSLYYQLNNYNLSFAVLLTEDGDMEDVFLDYTLQNFTCQAGTIRFRIADREELKAQIKAKEEKDRIKELNKQKYNEKRRRRK